MGADSTAAWDASAAIRDCRIQPWSGLVWRCHTRRYNGDDAAGSLRTTGRYNRGSDIYATHETWPALYTSLAEHVALGERMRHTTAKSLNKLGIQRLTCLRVDLREVLVLCAPTGCGEIGIDGMEFDDFCSPAEYGKCHQIAELARTFAEALLVPSCTRFPEGNLIIFPDRLHGSSSLTIETSIDPDLYVDWEDVTAKN